MNLNLSSICTAVESIAGEAASLIRNERSKLQSSEIEIKGLNDLVTYIDKSSEQFIVESLKDIVPNAGYITEENSIKPEKADYQWIIDPLDGTTNFVHGLQPYAVSIALMYRSTTLLGVVYEITGSECYSAIKSKGAFMNSKRIKVSSTSNIKNSLYVTGFPVSNFSRNKEYFRLMDYLIQNSHGVRRLGSAAADLAFVACGRLDAFYEYDLKPWDVAGGAIIVEEAGGRVGDFSGLPNHIFGKEIIASNSLIFSDLQNIIADFMQHKK
ncbi:MAG: inositol monophosphatase [Bacteroidales bacterium]|nr:inositol monophosphatase [Bacteroidales bacterium]HOY39861.1 inositol monophosphatase family protein [Bacteroidales bacterium]HQP04849.1 inositol monophosphatase family protein [Bacteroidales bacterium]